MDEPACVSRRSSYRPQATTTEPTSAQPDPLRVALPPAPGHRRAGGFPDLPDRAVHPDHRPDLRGNADVPPAPPPPAAGGRGGPLHHLGRTETGRHLPQGAERATFGRD